MACKKIAFVGSLAAHEEFAVSLELASESVSSKTITIGKDEFDIGARNGAILPGTLVLVSTLIILDPISFFETILESAIVPSASLGEQLSLAFLQIILPLPLVLIT